VVLKVNPLPNNQINRIKIVLKFTTANKAGFLS